MSKMTPSDLPLNVVFVDIETIKILPVSIVSADEKASIVVLMTSSEPDAIPQIKEIVGAACKSLIEARAISQSAIDAAAEGEDISYHKSIVKLSLVSEGFLFPPAEIIYKEAPVDGRDVKHRNAGGDNPQHVKAKEAPTSNKQVNTRTIGGGKVKHKDAPVLAGKKVKYREAGGGHQPIVKRRTIEE